MPGLSQGLNVLTQNVAFALPAKVVKVYADGAPTLQQSTTEAFTANTAVTLVEGQYEAAGGFIRSTGAAAQNLWVKPF